MCGTDVHQCKFKRKQFSCPMFSMISFNLCANSNCHENLKDRCHRCQKIRESNPSIVGRLSEWAPFSVSFLWFFMCFIFFSREDDDHTFQQPTVFSHKPTLSEIWISQIHSYWRVLARIFFWGFYHVLSAKSILVGSLHPHVCWANCNWV